MTRAFVEIALAVVCTAALGRAIGILMLKRRQARTARRALAAPRDWRDLCTVPEPYLLGAATIGLWLTRRIPADPEPARVVLAGAGLLLALLAIALMLGALRAFPSVSTGHYVLPEQPVVTAGPYAWVRHPLYLAAILVWLALASAFASAAALALALLYVIPGYWITLRAEEAMLIDHRGDAYVRYRERVGALLPRRGRALGALAALLVLGLAAWLARGPIALRVMRAAALRNFEADFVGDLPDGLHLLLCGAGGPLPDPVRSGPCLAVIAGRRLLVVDAGSGAARNLLRMGVAPGRIDALFLTHVHSDHIDGLGELALQRWAGGSNASPLPLLGPPGVEEVVAGFDRAYRQDAFFRTLHHGPDVLPPGGAGLEARPFPAPSDAEARTVWERDGVRVTAFRVDHLPVDPAVGYRFDYRGRSLVISGDTRRSENVLRNARGVDLLAHEALSPRLVGLARDAAAAAGRANLAKILADIPDYHTTPVEAAGIAREAGVRHLLFVHVVPPLPLPGLDAVFLDGVAEAYGGGVTLGRDGTLVSLPAGSDAVELSRR